MKIEAPKARVFKKIGLFTLILITINSILGSGIFALPGKIYQEMAGNFWIAILVSTIMAILLSIVFSYAAKFVQKSGAAYAYAKEAFGNLGGSIVGIMKAFTTILVNATLITISISQLGKYMLSFGGIDIGYQSKHFYIGWIIIVCILTLYTLIITSGGKTSGLFTNMITLAKLTPLIIIIFVGMAYITKHTSNFSNSIPGKLASDGSFIKGGKITGMIGGILTLFYAYLGFDSLANSAEIYKNPKRNIPIALMTTMSILVLVYTFVMIISIGALPKEILNDPTKNIIAEAARTTFMGNAGFHLIMVGSLISMFGITFMALFYTPYVISRMAKDGLFPSILSLRNKKKTYYVASWFALIITILLSFSGTWNFLLQINVLSRFVQFIPTAIAIMIFKRRFRSKVKTSILVDIAAVLSILILVFLVIIQLIPLDGVNKSYYATLKKLGFSLAFFVLAIIISFVYSRHNMDLIQSGNRQKIFVNKTGWRAQFKNVLLWIFVPFIMYKRTDANFTKVYNEDKTNWADQIETKNMDILTRSNVSWINAHIFEKANPVLLKALDDKTEWEYLNPFSYLLGNKIKHKKNVIKKFVKKENETILKRNIKELTKFILQENQKMMKKYSFVKIDKLHHFIFDYETNTCEFYIKYKIINTKNKAVVYNSFYNKMSIKEVEYTRLKNK